MLSQVERASKRGQAIVFLGWEPHPMNTRFKMKYLTGGDEFVRPRLRPGHHATPTCARAIPRNAATLASC